MCALVVPSGGRPLWPRLFRLVRGPLPALILLRGASFVLVAAPCSPALLGARLGIGWAGRSVPVLEFLQLWMVLFVLVPDLAAADGPLVPVAGPAFSPPV